MPISTAYTPPPFDYCDEASTGKVIPFIKQSSLSSSIRPPLGPGPETPMPFSTALLVADTRAGSVLSRERSDYIIPTCSGHESRLSP
jgi:hypothetical protein